jgi:hypothetical protein
MSEFGLDTSAVDTLDLVGELIDDALALVQACGRRLITPRGALWYDPNYGTDVRQFIADVVPEGLVESAVINELFKEEAVDAVTCKATRVADSLSLKISIVASDVNLEFTFVLSSAGIQKLVVS